MPKTAKAISVFFEALGFKLRNVRWSWGARSEDGQALLLRTWSDEFSVKDRTVAVLREPERYLESDSYGLDERLVHLHELWEGRVAGYVVVATVKDEAAHPREIVYYRDDAVFPIIQLTQREDGSILARLQGPVAVSALSAHRATHRTQAADGPFPIDNALRSGLSTDGYVQKLPAMRDWLIGVCRRRGTVTYGEVMDRFGLTFWPLRNALGKLGHESRAAGQPILTAVVVDKTTGRCSQGIFDEFGIDDDAAERERCYALWTPDGNERA